MNAYRYIHTQTHMQRPSNASLHAGSYKYAYAYVCVCVCLCIYIYMYIYVYIHTRARHSVCITTGKIVHIQIHKVYIHTCTDKICVCV